MSEWTKLTVSCRTPDLDEVCAIVSMVSSGLMIEDYSDLTPNGMYGDLIDESILNADKTHAAVSIFIPSDKNIAEDRAFLDERFAASSLDVTITYEGVSESDWAENWKQFYKPIKLKRITVVPAWEDYNPAPGEVTMRMDPGMAFGTGSHETTRLVMETLEDELRGGERVLDVGCGSGILSICAAKLGARECMAYDIDPVAVRVARENVEREGLTNITCGVSDLLAGVDLSGGKYDFCVANIVSDIIIRMLPDVGRYLTDSAKMVLSGIIGCRAEEVRRAIRENGYEIISEREERDWLAILVKRAGVR